MSLLVLRFGFRGGFPAGENSIPLWNPIDQVAYMEKRTIIAFVLSFLVLIVWTELFTPKPGPNEKKGTVKTEEPEAISDSKKQRISGLLEKPI